MISFFFVVLTKLIYKDIRILGFSKKDFLKKFILGYLIGGLLIAFIVFGYVLIGGADFQEVFAKSSWVYITNKHGVLSSSRITRRSN